MSDGSVIIDVLLDKKDFDAKVAELGSVVAGATAGFAVAAAGALAVSAAVWTTAKTAADAGERIKEMSAKLGFSTTKFQEWDYVLSQSGGNIESLGIGMKTLTEKIADASSGGEASIKTFNDIGISVESLRGKTREQIFETVVRALQNTQNETLRATTANDLLGRSYMELAPVLATSSEETDGLRKRFYDLNLLISNEVIKGGDDFKDSLAEMLQVFTKLAVTIGSDFMPALTAVMKWVSEFTGNKANMELMTTAFKVSLIAATGLTVGIGAMSAALVILNWAQISAAISASAFGVALAANPLALTIGLIAGVVAVLVLLVLNMGSVIEFFKSFWTAFKNVADYALTGLATWLTVTLPDAFVSCTKYFANYGVSFDTVFNTVTLKVKSMTATMKDWAASFKASVASAVEYLKLVPEGIGDMMGQAWLSFKAGAAGLITGARDYMTNFVNTMVDSIKSLPEQMFNYGRAIIQRLWDGIKQVFANLIADAKRLYAELTSTLSGGNPAPSSVQSMRSSVMSSFAPTLAPAGAGGNITFIQTIHSPTALSPADIRREAENSLTLWGL